MWRASVLLLDPVALAASSSENPRFSLARAHRSKRWTIGSEWSRWSVRAYADCEGRVSTIRYRAASDASCGLALLTSQSARSMWPRAAPAVTKPPDFTSMFDSSSSTFGYRARKSGPSHHAVVAWRRSSNPDSAITNDPIHPAH